MATTVLIGGPGSTVEPSFLFIQFERLVISLVSVGLLFKGKYQNRKAIELLLCCFLCKQSEGLKHTKTSPTLRFNYILGYIYIYISSKSRLQKKVALLCSAYNTTSQ
jgi:hypothetical protein